MNIIFEEILVSSIGERIRQLREGRGWKVNELATMLSMSGSAISQYENGKISVRPAKLKKIADLFKVSEDWLLTGMDAEGVTANEPPALYGMELFDFSEYVDLPFVPVPARATFVEMVAHLGKQSHFDSYRLYNPTKEVKTKPSYVIEVNGDSMEPQLRHGAKVLAIEVPKGDWCYQTGKVYAVAFDNQFVIKRISDNALTLNNTLKLVSDNPKGGSLIVTGEQLRGMWRIIKVIDSGVE